MDKLHHVALQVNDIQATVDWYKTMFDVEIAYQDESWALMQFENISVAFVLPDQHPPHIAFAKENAADYGPLKPHRDGTASVYLEDPSGNHVEMLKLVEK